MELWDAYNADGTLAGVDLVRGEKIPEGLRHAVAEVFVLHRDGSILLMQRDHNKPNYPGFWESGAGGSVLKGEQAVDGAKRELFEETGIVAEKLLPIYHAVSNDSIYYGYLCITDIYKDDIRLQKGETIDFRWVNKREFMEIFFSDNYVRGLKNRLGDFLKQDFKALINEEAAPADIKA